MRFKHLFTALFLVASFAHAQDLKTYRTGTLSQPDAAACASQQESKDHTCRQYILESDGVEFHIRPKRERNTAPLSSDGGRAEFRIQNGNMMLRMEGIGTKEQEYIIVSIAPRSESSTADARSMRVNHLQ